jgi:hypothetical protein
VVFVLVELQITCSILILIVVAIALADGNSCSLKIQRPINGLLFTGYYLSVARVTSVIRVVMVSVLSGYAG